MTRRAEPIHIAIACGGTGGHLFPGLAVGEELQKHGCRISLLISPKDVDQQAVKNVRDMKIVTLPGVGLQGRNYLAFLRGCYRSYRAAKKVFKANPPQAVLAMGGFTSAPPVMAGRSLGAKTFLHESNTIPGKANRWLARFVDVAFVGFEQTTSRLGARKTVVSGTPVRPQFLMRASARCRAAFGLDTERPVVLVMGGSQGASGINDMVLSALPLLVKHVPQWQWLHLSGANDAEKVKAAYAAAGVKAVVHPFLSEMELAMGAATISVSRAGASSLAEIAAMRLPSLLVPYPTAADDHQLYNARAFVDDGAALLLEQKDATPEKVCDALIKLVEDSTARATMQAALARGHAPKAAEQIAGTILEVVARSEAKKSSPLAQCSCGHSHTETKVIA
ncbi:MAG TPA: undecaprenyldiphospho-muramoylpentapeptide beta-N-acetylglucosaminyltransferase [Verrucomicrobiae bacterium]|jgi:UDP-N-acetylglucosamine--N-acetylmuramyl-(pentapeptide) pyrophosphoryl-undecaprenol N-acetylglucosamine transferase|nr:undecaprenyldiphospho-muramoylpentapeptide beta-N-acetylglucosaminyltransferase [Verrucomicrobiae bacterium]